MALSNLYALRVPYGQMQLTTRIIASSHCKRPMGLTTNSSRRSYSTQSPLLKRNQLLLSNALTNANTKPYLCYRSASTIGGLPTTEWTNSPSKFDFRSDTFTTPTLRQLKALEQASLGDDVYFESATTSALEGRLAEMFGKENAIFVMSGTMGNQLALRSLLEQPPYSVLCDSKSHIYCWEAGGLSVLSQALMMPIASRNGKYLTLEDITKHAVLSENIHHAPTKVLSLENTSCAGGHIMPIEEVRRIRKWAKKNGIKMHLDGARLWNAVSAGEGDTKERVELLRQYAREFDTVTVCFSKGIGAPIGSIVLSTNEIVNKVRHFRKAIGGGIRQAGVLTAMAEAAMDEVFMEGRLKEVNEKAKRIGEYWKKQCGGRLKSEVETNIILLDLTNGQVQRLAEIAAETRIKVSPQRIIVHWQIIDEAVDKLCAALAKLAKENRGDLVSRLEESRLISEHLLAPGIGVPRDQTTSLGILFNNHLN